MSRRIERLNEQFRREISDILQFGVKDPRIGHVTVTEARVAPDLSFARVYVRPSGDQEERDAAFEGLEAAAPFIRRELSKRLEVRTVPAIRFEADLALDHAMHIEKLLREVGPMAPQDAPEEGPVE